MAFLSRLIKVKMDLERLTYISYPVPSVRLRQFVLRILPIASIGDGRAYVSFVAMKCRRVRLSGICWPRFDYDQLNLRTYVSDPRTGDPAVYFLHSGVSISIVPMITRLLGIPWEKVSLNMGMNLSSGYQASGDWLGKLDFEVELREDESLNEPVVSHLTGPMTGFIGTEDNLRKFKISHRELEVVPAVLNYIRFSLPVDRGLILEKELHEPDNVLMVPKTEFTVYLPPKRVRRKE